MKEVGLIARRGSASLASRAAVRDDRGLARLRRRHGPAACDPRIPPARRFAGRRAGGDARLFRLQQGRRLRHLGLGALQGRDRPGRGVPPSWRAHPPVPRPRRLGRARRRPELRRDPRPAGRRGAGADPHHRAGRDHLEQIFEPRRRAAQSRDARLRDARGDAVAGRKPGARPRVSGDDGGTVAQRLQRLSRPRLRDRGLRALFLGLDRHHRNRQPQHRLAAGLAQEDDGDRRLARHSLGVLLGAVPADAAGLVRLRLGGEGLYRRPSEGRPSRR